jgi:lipopolysaccharide assembly outer membrane protein LptD (OstA)
MRRLPAIYALVFASVLLSLTARAQMELPWVVKALDRVLPGGVHGEVTYDPNTEISRGTNGVYVQRGSVVMTADSASVEWKSGQVVADGHVRIESGGQIWMGEHVRYNMNTHQMESGEFRTGKPPIFAGGEAMDGDVSDANGKVFTGGSVYVTSDDFSDPTVRVRASQVVIIPGKTVEMWNAVVWIKGVPVFYFPYYKRNLGKHANNLNMLPGYRSVYGAYLMNTYTWYLNDEVDGKLHLDYRTSRGVGTGPDLNLHMDRWGEASLRYYYLHDDHPDKGTNGLPNLGAIPENRERFHLNYQATPYTNLNVKSVVDYQTDPLVEHDYFESDYRNNPRPDTFVEVNPYWENWSLDTETTPQVNGFYDQVDRLPDVQLTGFRQEVGTTPLYYDSQSSAGYYRRYFAATNSLNEPYYPGGREDYSAGRADTYHQVLVPWTFFDWLNVAPRAGGRLTYYSDESGPGATNDATTRTVFNTGMNTSFKASQLWTGATNSFLQVDGLRHVIEPSVDYVYVPTPSATPNQLPQFDSDLPSLLLLPVDFPDYNNIDSIDSQNVVRFGLRNTLETKRDGQADNLVDWNLMMDWRLAPNGATNALNLGAPGPQKTFDDLYSHLAFKPRTWLTIESQLREDINSDRLNMAFHQITYTPNERWSWGIGDWYLANGFPAAGVPGVNLITSTVFYRLDDNWGLRATHYFQPDTGHLQEQYYTLYRDMRSWTCGLTFRVQDNGTGEEDYTVAFSFSVKIDPKGHVGDDSVRPYHLVGD